MNDLTRLEKEVMFLLLAGSDPIFTSLRKQLNSVKITARKLTGTGFFTTFEVSSEIERLSINRSFKIGDVRAKLKGLNHGAGFLLYIQCGVLDILEGYSYDEPWPPKTNDFELSYINGEKRDYDSLRKNLLQKNGEFPL